MAVRTIREQNDRQQIVADRTLAIFKDRAGRDAELMLASAALPNRTRGRGASLKASAARAVGLAAIVGPTDALEGGATLVIRHARYGAQ